MTLKLSQSEVNLLYSDEIWKNTEIYCTSENMEINEYTFCVSMNKITYTRLFHIYVKILCYIQNKEHKISNYLTSTEIFS